MSYNLSSFFLDGGGGGAAITQARSKQLLVGQARKWVWFVVN